MYLYLFPNISNSLFHAIGKIMFTRMSINNSTMENKEEMKFYILLVDRRMV